MVSALSFDWNLPAGFFYVNDAVVMPIRRDLNEKSSEVFIEKKGHLQPQFHPKGRQLSTQLQNGLLFQHW